MPARADSPEVFSGSAAGKALDLIVLDKQATFGASEAKADSTGAATAKGTAVLLPAVTAPVPTHLANQEADASKADPDVKAKKCEQNVTLDAAVEGLLGLGIVCSAAEARKNGGNPSAKGEGSIAELDLNGQFAVDALGDTELGATVSDLLDRVCDTVTGLPAGGEEVCAATDTLQDVVTSVLETKTLEATVGKSTSSVITEAGKVTSTATAAGAVIKILPLPNVDGLPSTEPIVTISVSEASATAVYDRATGAATASFDPALVRIKFNPTVTDALPQALKDILAEQGISLNEIAVTPGDPKLAALACSDDPSSICLFEGLPLETRIRAGNGRVTTNADGSVTAVADGVRVEVFKGLAETTSAVGLFEGDAVTLNLAHAEAAVGGSPAQVTPTTQPPANPTPTPTLTPELSRTLPPAELPRTGGTPWIPLVGATVLSLAVLGRRVAAKATR